jgi:NitT/TauT family transport system ATP-binding protein
MIALRDAVVEYGQGRQLVRAVDKVTLHIDRGQSLALIGPSGCGKTSLLFAVAGLHRATSGTVEVDGVPVHGPRKEIALILQNAGLLPWKTVLQNANLSLRLNKEYPKKTADELLEDLGLGGVKSRFPAELSEGMKRRVGIARALSTSPSVMLMDEPLASLDTLTRERIQDLFLDLWKQHRFAVLSERPARIKAIVDNAGMGERDYRGSESFMDIAGKLREALEA